MSWLHAKAEAQEPPRQGNCIAYLEVSHISFFDSLDQVLHVINQVQTKCILGIDFLPKQIQTTILVRKPLCNSICR